MNITQRNKKYNEILQAWQAFFEEPIKKLVHELYRRGAVQKDISNILELSEGVISRKYPNPYKEGSK